MGFIVTLIIFLNIYMILIDILKEECETEFMNDKILKKINILDGKGE